MKGLLGQDSGGRDPRDETPEWLEKSRTTLIEESLEVGGAVATGPHEDVFISQNSEVIGFAAWVSPTPNEGAETRGALALRGEWPAEPGISEAGAPSDALPDPLHHPLIEVATELRESIRVALEELGVAPMDDDEGARLTTPTSCEEGLPAEAPMVQFARGAALVSRSLKRCRNLRLRQRDGVQQLRLAGYEALLAYRSLKASSDLMNDVRIAAYSLGKMA